MKTVFHYDKTECLSAAAYITANCHCHSDTWATVTCAPTTAYLITPLLRQIILYAMHSRCHYSVIVSVCGVIHLGTDSCSYKSLYNTHKHGSSIEFKLECAGKRIRGVWVMFVTHRSDWEMAQRSSTKPTLFWKPFLDCRIRSSCHDPENPLA